MLTTGDAATTRHLADSVSMAMLVVLETLSPLERAVYVMQALLELLAPEVTLVGDGGGQAKAPLRIINGAGKVARFLIAIAADPAMAALEVELMEVNGGPAVLARDQKYSVAPRWRPAPGAARRPGPHVHRPAPDRACRSRFLQLGRRDLRPGRVPRSGEPPPGGDL